MEIGLNDLALEELNKGNTYAAQEYFRRNAKEHPTGMSLNNLGVFYITEGLQLKAGKVRKALGLGCKFLERAKEFGLESPQNLLALGGGYYDQGEYKKAEREFFEAIKLGESKVAPYNYGVVAFLLKDYHNSTKYLEKYFTQSLLSGEAMDEHLLYVFSLLHHDTSKANGALRKLLASGISHIEMDSFILAYLCDEMILAKNLCEKMFTLWAVPPVVMAMVFDCMFRLKLPSEAKRYKDLQEKNLENYDYDTKREVCEIKKVFVNKKYRDSMIQSYAFQPLLKRGCYYIGCKLHTDVIC